MTGDSMDNNIKFLKNYRYGEYERNVLDLAFPEGSGRIDLLLFIHGGAWSAGDKEMYENEVRFLAGKGLAAAAMNYRYVSESSSCFDILDDITAALDCIKAEGAKRGIEIKNCLLTGISAGAHLSLLYAYAKCDIAPIHPAAVVSLSGPTDFVGEEAIEKFVFENEMGDANAILELMSKFWGVSVNLENYKTSNAAFEAARALSPLYYVNENCVPTLICHAPGDKIVPFCNAVDLDKALSAAGVEHGMIVFPNSSHVLCEDRDCLAEAHKISKQYVKKYLTVYNNNPFFG